MIRIALIGLGKMGLSHHAIINSHPDAALVAVCDQAGYVLDVLSKYTGVRCYTDYRQMLDEALPDAVFIATPSRLHGEMVRAALERNVHVFCEKPFCLDLAEGARLVQLAEERRLVNQVGYHNRFVAAFEETRRLIDSGILGEIHHVKAEAYGPVVLRPKGATWRASKNEGGGCLYDYASHGIDLINYMIGKPDTVGGTALNRIFSNDVEDEVYSTLFYQDGKTAQIAANWSDESFRKMSSRITVWGRHGKIIADRQEVQVYLRKPPEPPGRLVAGWNTLYTTALTKEVWFYLRGEEYSAQVDHFIQCIKQGIATRSPFRSAHEADLVAGMMIEDALRPRGTPPPRDAQPAGEERGGWRDSIKELYASLRQT
ncbi:Gfo/Idh/MocA family protein [Massilia horti]|uniref:Gfo/Idh/MocA family oxidoreductase n=1 Tax=Massilia horti TaxID=2562153 RepID=A0A4Y9T7M2_9BURK|nr:Gfo/Idh/MocA family oxidoreductase [Massilia horti]TFW34378.1 Gfo/Idh/MocA family oxidoreductase [Massilia horti]